MIIGILIAMDKEFQRVVGLLADAKEDVVRGRRFVSGKVGLNVVVLHQCGVGKVNAAIGTTELIGLYAPDVVISTGVAGGASVELNVQDVVVSTETVYHDAYCGEELAYGQIIGSPARFESGKELVQKALQVRQEGIRIVSGLIVSGDWFVDSREKMSSIMEKFPEAMAVDMESCAIAQVCGQQNIPFVSFRIISDVPLKDHKAQMYFDFWDRMADNSFSVT